VSYANEARRLILEELFLDLGSKYASNLVSWGKLGEKLKTSPPPLSQDDYCQLVVDLANGERIGLRRWDQLIGVAAYRQGRGPRAAIALPEPIRLPLVKDLQVVVDRIDAMRKLGRVRQDGLDDDDRAALEAAVAKLRKKRVEADDMVTAMVVLVPTFAADGSEHYRVVAKNLVGALAYGLRLLANGDDLCRCRAEACGRFFLKRQGDDGAPIIVSCRREHHKDALRDKKRLDMQALRAKAREESKR